MESRKFVRSDEARQKMRLSHLGIKFTMEHRMKIGLAHKGKHPHVNPEVERERRRKISMAHTGMKHPWAAIRLKMLIGSLNPSWKGGVSPIEKIIRGSEPYKKWRLSVFERDNYTCQMCGVRGGVELHPHHIKPFSKFPDFRFDVNNGQTLCVPCHKQTSTYAGRIH